jgi:hypothetical protein
VSFPVVHTVAVDYKVSFIFIEVGNSIVVFSVVTLLGSGRSVQMFQRKILPPYSMLKLCYPPITL